ncbi:MAG: hypothetical protein ABFD97_13785 [Syntrophobacter sp.]
MPKSRTSVDSEALHFANLAVMAEQAGNYEEAAKHWAGASEASSGRDKMILYKEAAKRCLRRSKQDL